MSREESLSLALSSAKDSPIIRLIYRRGVILFSIIFFIFFLILDMPLTSYESLRETLGETGINILDKVFLLLLSLILGVLIHRVLRYLYISAAQNTSQELPEYIFGNREITLSEEGLVIQYPKHTMSFSWDVLQEYKDKDGYVEITTPVAKEILIPHHAFSSHEEKEEFKSFFQENRSELMSSWLQTRDELKKQTKTKSNINRILRVSILGFLFGPLSFIVLPFVLSMAKDEAKNIENHPDAQNLSKRIKTAKFIAYLFPLLWGVSCIAVVVLFIFAQ